MPIRPLTEELVWSIADEVALLRAAHANEEHERIFEHLCRGSTRRGRLSSLWEQWQEPALPERVEVGEALQRQNGLFRDFERALLVMALSEHAA